MKKYSLEEIENLDHAGVLEIAKAMVEGKFQIDQYTRKVLDLIVGKIRQEYEKCICTETAKIFKHEFSTEQLQALKEAFLVSKYEEWLKCRSALRIFFGAEDPEDLHRLDLSEVDYRHVVDWYEMLVKTHLSEERDGTSVRIFFDLILDEFISRMPLEGRLKMREGLKMFFPEFYGPLESMESEGGVPKWH